MVASLVTELRPDRASRSARLVILAVVLCLAAAGQAVLAVAYGPLPGSARDGWGVALGLWLLLSLPTAALLWATWRARDLPAGPAVVVVVAVSGLLMRLPYFGVGPMLEDDHFRFLLDGAMVAQGLSPYAHAPEALLRGAEGVPADLVTAGRDTITRINFPDLRSMYPGGGQALFALAHLMAPWRLDGLRLVVLVAEALTAVLVWRTLVASGRPPVLVALCWCNPLLAFTLTGQAHVDAALAPPLLGALLAAGRNRGGTAGVLLGLAAGIKLWPVMLVPLVARALGSDRRSLAAFGATCAVTTLALCGPLLWESLSPAARATAGLTAYAGGWSVNNAPYAWMSFLSFRAFGPGTGDLILRALLAATAAGVSLALAVRPLTDRLDLIARAAILAAVLFYLSPAQFPWYAAWFLPFAVAGGQWALAAATLGLPVYYLFFPLAAAGLRDVHGFGLAALHLVPVILAMAWRRRTAMSGSAA